MTRNRNFSPPDALAGADRRRGPANRVAVIDAQSYEIPKYLLVGQWVWSLAFNPDQSRVYTTNGVSNDVSVIDVGSLKVLKSVPVGQAPWGVVSRP
jgi:YVTN family beta-propeller protein